LIQNQLNKTLLQHRNVYKLICLIGLYFSSTFCLIANNYFQQKVNYNIKVILDDENHSLIGDITIQYINNSHDTLNFIYVHLWPNAYKNNNTAFAKQLTNQGFSHFFYSNNKDRGYIDSLSFSVNNKNINYFLDKDNIDIAKIELETSLIPGDSIKIHTPFYVKIPYYYSRLGHHGNEYYISQWFPKPAVYDKDGWHQMPYLDQGEFYSEYGDFNVDIFVPKNYIVAATGHTSQHQYLEGDIDPFLSENNLSHYKKVSFTESNIHDFAWFASKNFVVEQRTMQLKKSGKKIRLYAYHSGEIYKKYENALEYMESAIQFYSEKCFEYPYNTCKVVISDSEGGMEYPTITLLGYVINELDFESLIVHELGHNWFYGILGSNERQLPWIDEGFNSFYELQYFQKKYTPEKYKEYYRDLGSKLVGLHNLSFTDFYKIHYQKLARQNCEMPLNLSADKYDSNNYYYNIYFKTALGINMLKDHLGEQKFDSIMQSFFQKWQNKHPDNEDIVYHFKNNTSKDVDWFFNDFLTSTKKCDYKISKVKNGSVFIKNTKSFSTPFKLRYSSNNLSFDTIIYRNEKKFQIDLSDKNFNQLMIDPENSSIDLNQRNNNYNKTQLLNKYDPIKLKFIGYYEQPGTHQINFTPIFGWNNYDKLMPGLIFYNSFIPSHAIEYIISPFYGLASNQIVGSSIFKFYIPSFSSKIQAIDLNLSVSRYSITHDLSPYTKILIQPNIFLSKTSTNQSFLSFKYYLLNIPLEYINGEDKLKNLFQFSYNYKKNETITKHEFVSKIETSKGFVKSSIETNHLWKYTNKSSLKLRFFAGAFIYNSDDYYGDYNFRLSGVDGIHDYTYSNIFLGRSETPGQDSLGILERQFIPTDGGFSTFTYLGQTNDWLIASNIFYKPPILIPIKAYLNLALVKTDYVPNNDPFFWESGVEFYIIPDIFEVYFPVFMSKNLSDQSKFLSDNYWDKVRFSLKLNLNDPFLFIKSMN
jgi:Peptidase family M1 domain